jgi:macrophage erythroblast attacher
MSRSHLQSGLRARKSLIASTFFALTFQRLYDNGRWANLRKEFRETFNSLYALPSQSLLSLSVSAGLSSLKLAACCPDLAHHTAGPSDQPYDHSRIGAGSPIPSLPAAPPIHVLGSLQLDPSLSEGVDPQPLHVDPSHPHRNLDCPSCHDSMAELVKQVPYSHHVNSTIVCRMSGKVMDDENYPMAFPNGYVYSHKVISILFFWHPWYVCAKMETTGRLSWKWPKTAMT